jgi:F0F1-type ATP synthase assembly protein I
LIFIAALAGMLLALIVGMEAGMSALLRAAGSAPLIAN